MSYDTMNVCAAMTLATAIEDMSEKQGKTVEEIRNEVLESKAYECLMDFESGLWGIGPDYFRDYYMRTKE